MKKLLILAGAATMVASAHANLIFNGDFESHQITIGSVAPVNAGNIATLVPYWSYFGDPNHDVALTGKTYLGQTTQEVDVSGFSDAVRSGIYQSFVSVANQRYDLTFQIYTGGTEHVGGVDMGVYDGSGVGGTLITSALNRQGFAASGDAGLQTFTYSFLATSSLTTVAFEMTSPNVSQVDNVQVNAVPEPFTMSLGIASAGLFLRRRLKTKRG